MFGFLGFILLFIFLIIIIALALIGNIARMIFGLGRRTPKQYNRQSETNASASENQASGNSTATNKKKIFGEDEGEYVEYEEIN